MRQNVCNIDKRIQSRFPFCKDYFIILLNLSAFEKFSFFSNKMARIISRFVHFVTDRKLD